MTDALARLKRVTKRRAATDEEWRAAIRAAIDAGASTRAVGAAAGISHVRVQQILRGQ